jgi:hypothetical protein
MALGEVGSTPSACVNLALKYSTCNPAAMLIQSLIL